MNTLEAETTAPTAPHGFERGALRAWPAGVIGAAFVHGLALSWRKWGSLVVDSGRELDLPRRMVEGQQLYGDLRYYYGPLAPNLNAALYRVFGVHTDVLAGAGVATAALMCAVLYFLARRFVDTVGATLSTVAFVYGCAFAHLYKVPIFNFVIPYSYAAVYGMLAATSSLFFLVRHLEDEREADLWLSAGFLSLAALAKLEALFAAGLVHGAFLVALGLSRALGFRRLLPYLAALSVVLAVYGALAARLGGALWSDNLGVAFGPSLKPFVSHVMGLDDPAAAAGKIALSVAIGVGVIGATAVAGRWVVPGRSSRWVVVAGAGAVAFAAYAFLPGGVPLMFLPGVAAVRAVQLAVTWRSKRQAKQLSALLLWLFALACLSRIVFASSPYGYGFYLLPVPLIACARFLFGDLVGALSPGRGEAVRAASIGLFLGLGALYLRESDTQYAQHRFPVETPRGRWVLNGDGFESKVLEQLVALPPHTRVLPVPVGTGLAFLAGVDDVGDGMFSYFPPELSGSRDDAQLLARWQKAPPDLVLYIRWSMAEYGFREFGAGYGVQSFNWLRTAYVPASASFGPVVILRPAR